MLNFIDPDDVASDEKATDRIEMRISPGAKVGIRKAAELMGVSLSAFVCVSAMQKAERVLRKYQTTVLSERDKRTLLAALDNPPPPARAALEAAHRYRARIANAG